MCHCPQTEECQHAQEVASTQAAIEPHVGACKGPSGLTRAASAPAMTGGSPVPETDSSTGRPLWRQLPVSVQALYAGESASPKGRATWALMLLHPIAVLCAAVAGPAFLFGICSAARHASTVELAHRLPCLSVSEGPAGRDGRDCEAGSTSSPSVSAGLLPGGLE